MPETETPAAEWVPVNHGRLSLTGTKITVDAHGHRYAMKFGLAMVGISPALADAKSAAVRFRDALLAAGFMP